MPAILKIKLFSSPAKTVFVPLCSKWCDTCRKRTHYNLHLKNSAVIKSLNSCDCSACCSIHDTLENLQNHLSETPAKKQKINLKNDTTDDEDFCEEGSEHHYFNDSMIEINPKWTPIKYQHRTYLNAVSVKTKEKLVQKSNQAVKSILGIIAPGQSETLREACLEKTELISHGDILKYLQAAIMQSHISNDGVQLVSVLCAEDNGNKYIHTIAELLKLFPDMSKYLIEKARMHAAGGQAGMPIETGKYVKKRLTDAQVNHLLLKITAELKNSHRDTLNELEIIEKQLRDGMQYIKM